jgi:phenol hydroxylase P0 protein
MWVMVDLEHDASRQTHYVRVTGMLKAKYVEFDFSIGDPTLYVELVLPFDQFNSFCDKHKVKKLTAEQEVQVDLDRLKWRYGQPDEPIVENKLGN